MAEQLYAILLPNALGKKPNPKSITPKPNLISIMLIVTPPSSQKGQNRK